MVLWTGKGVAAVHIVLEAQEFLITGSMTDKQVGMTCLNPQVSVDRSRRLCHPGRMQSSCHPRAGM